MLLDPYTHLASLHPHEAQSYGAAIKPNSNLQTHLKAPQRTTQPQILLKTTNPFIILPTQRSFTFRNSPSLRCDVLVQSNPTTFKGLSLDVFQHCHSTFLLNNIFKTSMPTNLQPIKVCFVKQNAHHARICSSNTTKYDM
ncbi:hypothetical protein QL285_002369 [Trifolium repens]|nr:hypothetical protein QL285_002369 [Trifolium repens]